MPITEIKNLRLIFTALPAPDECAKDPCHEFADCTNVGSSYTCACKDGYMGDGVFCMGTVKNRDWSYQCFFT